MKRRALVTGAAGFIGSHLVRGLVRDGWQVRILSHTRTLDWPGECEVFQGDITDPASLQEPMERVETVFHLAAALGASQLDRRGFAQVNVIGTANLLSAAREHGAARFVHFSSAGVLGRVAPEKTADEETACRPQNIYDRTKLEAERRVLGTAADGLKVVVVRPGWVYGPGDRRTFKLIRAIARRRFMLVTRGRAWQTPVFVDDLVQGTLLCAEKAPARSLFHLAGPETLTVRQIVDTIAAAAGTRVPRPTLPLFPVSVAAWKLDKAFRLFHREAPLTPGRLAFFIHPKPLSSLKARQELGYAPPTDFRAGMERTLAWYRENGWL
jgi:nucleoside-diphosphate-sugar epimerase